MMNAEAPFRKAVVILRENGDLKVERNWEDWSKLSKRQIIRPAHSCRVNMTVFAQNPESEQSTKADVEMPEMSRSEQKTQTQAGVNQSRIESDTGFKPETRVASDMESVHPAEPTHDRSETPKESHGPRFKSLPKEEQQKLIRAHQNLGHPSNERLSNALKLQGCRTEISHGVLDMSCPTCQESVKPRHARPSRLHDCCDFNDEISMDGIVWTNKAGKKLHFYHVLDHGTNFHAAIIAPNRSSDSAIECLHHMWLMLGRNAEHAGDGCSH